MKACRRFAEGEREVPDGPALKSIEKASKLFQAAANVLGGCGHEIVRHGSGFGAEAKGAQTAADVHVGDFAAANGDDTFSAMSFDPAEGGIHEERGELST